MNWTADLMNMGVLAAAFAAALVLGFGAYALRSWRKALATRKTIDIVSIEISNYFDRSDIRVTVDCLLAPGSNNRFIVFIESEPMKQLRLSHIIETTLRDLVRNQHKLELDKVYWRFPIKQEQAANAGHTDDYIAEGLNYRRLPKADVAEASWETFEQAAVKNPETPPQ